MDTSKKNCQSGNEPYVPTLTPFNWFESIMSGDSNLFFALEDNFVASDSETPTGDTGSEKSDEENELCYESLSANSFIFSESEFDPEELIHKLNAYVEYES